MFKLCRIDLMDAYIWADVFQDDAYKIATESDSLDNLLDVAITEFKKDNTGFKNYEDWANKAEDCGWEWEIFHEARTVFRGSMLMVHPMIERALRLAQKWHKGDLRKGGELPYLIHILDISRLIYRNFRDEEPEILAASICHDLLEDTRCPEFSISDACGAEVLRIVKAVSHDTSMEEDGQWEERKLKYIESVKSGGEKAMLVCMCDKIVNLKSLLTQYEVEGPDVWQHFNRRKDIKLWFEKKVLEMLKVGLSHPLLEVYEGLIGDLERLEG